MPSSIELPRRWFWLYAVALAAAAAVLREWGLEAAERQFARALGVAAQRHAERIARVLPWEVKDAELREQCAALAREVGGRVAVLAGDGNVIADSASEPRMPLPMQADAGWVSASWREERGGPARTVVVSLPAEALGAGGAAALVLGGWALGLAAVALWPLPFLWRSLARRIDGLAAYAAAVAAGEQVPPQPPRFSGAIGRLRDAVHRMGTRLAAELQAAREEKSKLEAVLRGMIEGVVVVDRTGVVRLANPRAGELFGLGRQPLEGRLLVEICRDPDLHDVWREAVESEGKTPRTRLLAFEGGGGQQVQVTVAPVAGPDRRPEGFVCVLHDVTELRRLETARRDFVANVSHELRTPLTAIRGYAETLATGLGSDPERARKFAEIIWRHSERLSRLVDDLLALSDLELGRAPLQRVPVALLPVVEGAVEVVRGKAAERGIALALNVSADLPEVVGDRDRLEQLLVNLLDNAVKYTPPGGRVTVEAEFASMPEAAAVPPPPARRGERCVALRVRDTGIGIPRRDLPRVTERFFRVDRARSRELGGTGLGLAIAKHIVQAHEGSLVIESEHGRGTTVSVYLPIAPVAP